MTTIDEIISEPHLEARGFWANVRGSGKVSMQMPGLPFRLSAGPCKLGDVAPALDQHEGEVCYIAAADFAHIGQRFGDRWLLDEERLAEQSAEDHRLLEAVCRCDSAALFSQVAQQDDRSRICGLSPTYVMLKVMDSARGELLHYDQAVEPDGTSCVSFASVAFYQE